MGDIARGDTAESGRYRGEIPRGDSREKTAASHLQHGGEIPVGDTGGRYWWLIPVVDTGGRYRWEIPVGDTVASHLQHGARREVEGAVLDELSLPACWCRGVCCYT